MPHTKRRVSLSYDHTLRSRVRGNAHARFWIGGGGSNPFADHTGDFLEDFEQVAVGTLKKPIEPLDPI